MMKKKKEETKDTKDLKRKEENIYKKNSKLIIDFDLLIY